MPLGDLFRTDTEVVQNRRFEGRQSPGLISETGTLSEVPEVCDEMPTDLTAP
jgi:hypothetical protein